MLTVLQGRARCGKTYRIIREVCGSVKAGRRAALIVPDQETFLYERRLCDALGGGFLQAEVISFNRLCAQIVRRSGRGGAVHLSDQGRAMLMKSAILSCREQLTVFKNAAAHTGFGEKMLRMAALMKSCGVSAQRLRELAQERPDGLLRRKLEDSCLICERYQALLNEGYADNNDLFRMAGEALAQGGVMADTDFYIDGFDVFTVVMQRFILALLREHEVTVALSASMGRGDARLYSLQEDTARRLLRECGENGIAFRVEELPARPLPNPVVQRIADGFGVYGVQREEALGVTLFEGLSTEAEVRNAAAVILRGVQEEGLRWRDYCVVCNAPEEYFPIIDRVFRLFGIPVFADVRRPVISQPLVQLILSALRACCAPNGLGSAACVEYMANALCPAPREATEELRELMQLLGAFPAELLSGEIVRGRAEQRARFKELHGEALSPLCAFKQQLTGVSSVGEFTRRIMQFVSENAVEQRLQAYIERLEAEGLLTQADECRSVWNLTEELLRQMSTLLGGARFSLSELTAVLEQGFSLAAAGVLPTTADCVLLGDLSRSKSGSVRRLIVLGMNEGVMPAPLAGEGLLSPAETDLLNAGGAELKPDTETLFRQQNYDIYSALLQAQEAVYFSCALTSSGGAVLARSSLLLNLERVLGPLETVRDGADTELSQLLLCPSGAAPLLGQSLRAARQGVPFPPELEGYLAYLHGEDSLVLQMQKKALAQRTPELCSQNAQALFAQRGTVSISRLETQAECPFRHFVQYGLSPKEQDLFEGNAVDIGSLLHEVMEGFLRDRMSMPEGALSQEQIFAMADRLFDEALPKQHFGALCANARARQLSRYLRAVARVSALEITRQLGPEGFEPFAQEAQFGDGKPIGALCVQAPHGTLRLKGVIDRIDILQTQEACYLRVIDYKSSDHRFSVNAVADGTQLQLPLYLCAAAGIRENAVPAGAYYLTLSAVESGGRARRFGVALNESAVVEALKREGEAPRGALAREGMEALMRLSMERAQQLTEEILTGRIAPSPLGNACDYCRYRRICGQDDGMGLRRRAGCKNITLAREDHNGMDG